MSNKNISMNLKDKASTRMRDACLAEAEARIFSDLHSLLEELHGYHAIRSNAVTHTLSSKMHKRFAEALKPYIESGSTRR